MTIHIGTSGWSYDHWTGVLYPPGLPSHERLSRYTQAFDTVELNASFYRWPRDGAFASWRRRLPHDFRLSVKAPRGLTHAKKLFAPEQWVLRIAASWHELGDRRAVLLVQLGPNQERDDARLAYFLDLLPDWISTAVELRHPSDDLSWWADRMREWEADGREVFAYFNNDGAGNAVRNAQTLRRLLGR